MLSIAIERLPKFLFILSCGDGENYGHLSGKKSFIFSLMILILSVYIYKVIFPIPTGKVLHHFVILQTDVVEAGKIT